MRVMVSFVDTPPPPHIMYLAMMAHKWDRTFNIFLSYILVCRLKYFMNFMINLIISGVTPCFVIF